MKAPATARAGYRAPRIFRTLVYGIEGQEMYRYFKLELKKLWANLYAEILPCAQGMVLPGQWRSWHSARIYDFNAYLYAQAYLPLIWYWWDCSVYSYKRYCIGIILYWHYIAIISEYYR